MRREQGEHEAPIPEALVDVVVKDAVLLRGRARGRCRVGVRVRVGIRARVGVGVGVGVRVSIVEDAVLHGLVASRAQLVCEEVVPGEG